MPFAWPSAFPRIPDEEWTRRPVEPRGLGYDGMKTHRWYRNLDTTIAELKESVRPGQIWVDYSCGTSILGERLLNEHKADYGLVNADVLPTFLRVAVEKLRGDERAAFRLLPIENGKVLPLDRVLGPALNGKVDGLVCTNAIHLFDDLKGALEGWQRALKPGATVFAQSAEIRNPKAPSDALLITDYVQKLRAAAQVVVKREARFAEYRPVLEQKEKMAAYERVFETIFQPVKVTAQYVQAMNEAGLEVVKETAKTIEVGVDEWYTAATVYSDIIAWVGGTQSVDGTPTSEKAQADRAAILKLAKDEVFGTRTTFNGCWTYITAVRR